MFTMFISLSQPISTPTCEARRKQVVDRTADRRADVMTNVNDEIKGRENEEGKKTRGGE